MFYRKILNVLWAVFGIHLSSIVISVIWEDHSSTVPSIWKWSIVATMLLILAGMESYYARQKKDRMSLNIGLTSLFSLLIIMNGIELQVTVNIYVAPLAAAALTMRTQYVLYTSVFTIVTYTAVFFLYPWYTRQPEIMLYVTSLTSLVFYAILAIWIMRLWRRMAATLKETLESKNELLVRNILMDKVSKMDALTDCYNHKTFHEYMDSLVQHNEQNGLSVHLALLDIDNFKQVNDTFGHWVGDRILQRIAQVLRDQVTADDIVARYGGEEFAIILTGKDLEEATALIENIRRTIAAMKHEELQGDAVTVSVGIRTCHPSLDKEQLFRTADDALYQAKRSGKNKIVTGTDYPK